MEQFLPPNGPVSSAVTGMGYLEKRVMWVFRHYGVFFLRSCCGLSSCMDVMVKEEDGSINMVEFGRNEKKEQYGTHL